MRCCKWVRCSHACLGESGKQLHNYAQRVNQKECCVMLQMISDCNIHGKGENFICFESGLW